MILIDAHVHIYDCFDLQIFFDSTLKNFQLAAEQEHIDEDFIAILFLTDWAKQDWYFKFSNCADSNFDISGIQVNGWKVKSTHDEIALFAEHWSGKGFYLIAGRKIITSENLEVLALATTEVIKDGNKLLHTISYITEKGALAVVPWAPGKWMGKRGEVINELLDNNDRNHFFLCDNGNRPIFWKYPSHFKKADNKGIIIISGSDPLHFASEATRAGSFGFVAREIIDRDRPATDIKKILSENPGFQLYGSFERPYHFFRNQFLMQIKKRKYRKELSQ